VARSGQPVLTVVSAEVTTTLSAEGLPEAASARVGPLALTVTPLALGPVLLPPPPSTPAPRPSRLARALCRFDAGGDGTGIGWSSWLTPPAPGPGTGRDR
jgi:hypothetical protein